MCHNKPKLTSTDFLYNSRDFINFVGKAYVEESNLERCYGLVIRATGLNSRIDKSREFYRTRISNYKLYSSAFAFQCLVSTKRSHILKQTSSIGI